MNEPSKPPGKYAEARRYYRVTVRIPLRHRPLQPDEVGAVERELETPRPDLEDLSPALAGWLLRLEKKLDLTLSLLDANVPAPLSDRDLRVVEVSGAGLSFESKEASEIEGDELLEFELPGTVPLRVRAIARVVRHREPESQGGPCQVACEFRVIRTEDRESIVRFVNDVQRIELRRRAAEAGGT